MKSSHNKTESYMHFKVAIYATMYDVQKMADRSWLEQSFSAINRHIKVNKVYLETHRDATTAEQATVIKAKQFFTQHGIETAGGITYTINERNRFQTYCYTDQIQRQRAQEIAEYTAGLFDEFILDDFFFTNCKCEQCIAAKADRSWTDFRLNLMTEAAENLIIGPAKEINPDVRIIVKYPNWYEHFQGLGFNLETEPSLFDGVYTGTETRDPIYSNQHLQAYHGYSIVRYLENIKPGRNYGGWVDPFGSRYMDRYAEQLWLTLFAKAPEITLFNFSQIQRPITATHRADWQGQGTSFDFDEMISPWVTKDGEWTQDASIALAAGYAFEKIDPVIAELGNPIGIKSYRPYHATGEDYLHSYLGMLGIPIDLKHEFPADANVLLLTESAKYDKQIVEKITRQLVDGKKVIVTSGLFKSLQERGIRDIVEMNVTNRKANVQEFLIGWFGVHRAESAILIPHIDYLNNDSWEEVSGLTNTTGTLILHSATYANGVLYVLTIPDNFNDLYKLPVKVLTRIKDVLMADLPVRVHSPAQVMLFIYDNDTFIVESILPEQVDVSIITNNDISGLRDLQKDSLIHDGEEILDWRKKSTGKQGFTVTLKPHSFRVFKMESGK